MTSSLPPQLVLGSTSPMRLALLKQAGYSSVQVHSPQIDEKIENGEPWREAIMRLAEAKMDVVSAGYPDAYIITADTMGICQRRTLEKTEDPAVAASYLKRVSGRRHLMATAVCVQNPTGKRGRRLVKTRVHFKLLSMKDIAAYLTTNEWQNRAGGYAIGGYADRFIKSINGSYSNVMGLPLYETVNLLRGLGYPF